MTPEGWSARTLGELCEQFKEINVSAQDLPPLSVTKDAGIVLQSEKFNKRIATDISKYKVLRRGRFAYDPMSLYYGAIGRQERVPAGLVSPAYVTFALRDDLDPGFFWYAVKGQQLQSAFTAATQGGNVHGKRKKTDWESFSAIRTALPPVGEQRKIAAILSSVDDAIEATQSVIDQIGVVKRAMMVELLARGLPGRHTTFKQTEIGEVPEEWEVARMNALAVPKGMVGGPFGSDLTAKDYVREPGVPVIRGGNVSMGGFLDDEFVFVSEEKAKALSKNGARSGDLVMTQRGVSLGETTLIPSNSSHDWYVISQTMMRMTPDTSRASPAFLLHYVCGSAAQGWLQHHQIATGQPHLNLGIFRDLPVVVPPRDEQDGIAEAANRLDSATSGSVAELGELCRVKSALMSVLLTGEVRVTPDNEAA